MVSTPDWSRARLLFIAHRDPVSIFKRLPMDVISILIALIEQKIYRCQLFDPVERHNFLHSRHRIMSSELQYQGKAMPLSLVHNVNRLCTLKFPICTSFVTGGQSQIRLVAQVNDPCIVSFLRQLDEGVRANITRVKGDKLEYTECVREYKQEVCMKIKVDERVQVWEQSEGAFIESSFDKICKDDKMQIVLKPPTVWCTNRMAGISFAAQEICFTSPNESKGRLR